MSALDRLLAELSPPPVPAGLAGRIEAAALATAQEPHAERARRAVLPRRDRRGGWRRRFVIGAGAIGLAFSGAVAATLAGVPLPAKVEAVLAKLPLIGREAPPKAAPQVQARAERPHPVRQAAAPAATVPQIAPESVVPKPLRMGEIRRLRQLRRMVAARRAAGLPTPRADRIEQRLRRNLAERWQAATPAQRQRFLERRAARIEARRARIEAGQMAEPGPPLPPPNAARQERIEARRLDGQQPIYGPIDPRSRNPLADLTEADRLQRLEQRRERLRALRQERARTLPPPAARRPSPPIRREGPRRTTR